MRCFWVGSWIGAGHQKDQAVITSLEFSAPPPLLREERGAGNGVNNRLYLCDEAVIKILIVWGSERLWVGDHIYVLGSWVPQLHRDRSACAQDPCFSVSACSFVSFIMFFIINQEAWVCFPEFYEPFKQITEPKEGVMGTSICSQFFRSSADTLRLCIRVWSGGSLMEVTP